MYLQYLKSVTTQKQAALQKAETAFDQQTITTLTRLDSRMTAADTLLNAHIAPSIFFDALNQTTLSTVSFQSLTFSEADGSDGSTVKLTMNGVARDINSVALQADIFGKSGIITDAIFSGIDQEKDGVHFLITGTVDPAKITYDSLVTGSAAGVNALPGADADTPASQTTTSSGQPSSAPGASGPAPSSDSGAPASPSQTQPAAAPSSPAQ